ncbi:MAG: hypothetical protein AAF320_05620 [Myxococcota bacterium]
MVNRSRDWDEGLARDLQDPVFAREFVLAACEEGIPLQEVLRKVVRLYGVKEFAQQVGIPSSNVLRALHPSHNPTQETLDRLLAPFGLQLSVRPVPVTKKRAA